MKAARMVLVWGIVVTLGFVLSEWFYKLGGMEIHSVILLTAGVFGALINASSFQVLRRFDDPPIKNLTPAGAARIERVFEQRRKRFRMKWGIAISAGISAALAGSLLKVGSLSAHHHWLLNVGYISLALTCTLGLLIALEYCALSKLARELPKQLDEERQKNELLERLGKPPTVSNSH